MILTDEIETSWTPANKKHYISKGYVFTRMRDKLTVKVFHLSNKSRIKVECICENCWHTRILHRSDYNKYCAKCAKKLSPVFAEMIKNLPRRGPNHPNWNENLTEYDRENFRHYQPENNSWRIKIWKRDNWTCRICNFNKGHKGVVAHHLYSYSIHKDLRYDISNGVTLCESCHKEFHKNYGYKNNDPYQYIKFKLEKTEKINNLNIAIIQNFKTLLQAKLDAKERKESGII